ncbi:hypothetical protein DOY81_014471, partial [Sarcophaga bullata]
MAQNTRARLSRQAALVTQQIWIVAVAIASFADGKTLSHPVMRRPSLIKASNEKRLPPTNAVEPYNTNNTPNVVVGPKLYSRWADKRAAIRESANSMDTNGYQHHAQHHSHGHHGQTQQLAQESAIKFQIIPPHNEQQQQHQQQHYRHHYSANGSNSSSTSANHQQQLIATRNNLIMQQHQQQQQQMHTNQSNFNQVHNQTNNNNNNSNIINLNTNSNNNNNNSNIQQRYANTTNTTMQSQ